jgi:hypothetical protein
MNDIQSPAERKASERKRKRAAGLVPAEVWIKADKLEELKQIVQKLNND